jgi:hypothetical protein
MFHFSDEELKRIIEMCLDRGVLRLDLVGPPPPAGERPNWDEVEFIADFGDVIGQAFQTAYYEFRDDLRALFDTDVLELVIFPKTNLELPPDAPGFVRERLYTHPPDPE